MTASQWSAAGVDVRPVDEYHGPAGVILSARGGIWLGNEAARSLACWLLWWAGDRPAPADPDRVRAAVDEQRAALRKRSAAKETTEDFRAGLAWAEHALEAIAKAAS